MVLQRGGKNKGPQSSEVGKGLVGAGPAAKATGLAGSFLRARAEASPVPSL